MRSVKKHRTVGTQLRTLYTMRCRCMALLPSNCGDTTSIATWRPSPYTSVTLTCLASSASRMLLLMLSMSALLTWPPGATSLRATSERRCGRKAGARLCCAGRTAATDTLRSWFIEESMVLCYLQFH